ncbi:MAG TPA: ABC transporter permease [Terriglobales bacterium]|jgi:ribose/xylose/arabinose/galactoside ABC-type transport system permease subunit|nr:ABC transporter permease [Terriglobales bacterium]
MTLPNFLPKNALGRGRNLGLLITLVACLVGISIFSPKYLSIDNLLVVALQVSFVGIAAIGTAYLIIGGSVDLSIGSQYALCAVASAMLARSMPPPLAWIAGIALGAALGLVNGLMVWRIHISPIIITLGTLTIFRGVALRVTNGFGVRGVPKSFSWFGQTVWLGIPMPVWVLAVLALVAHVVLLYTRQGRHLFAFGGNREAAEAAGIDGKRLLVICFALNGALVGTSAVLAASRFGTAAPTFGAGFELDVIAAVILGGVVFTGGEGSIVGVLLAVVLLGVINSGLISIGIDPHYAQMVKGLALVIAVTLDQLTQEQQERHRKKLASQERAAT